MNAYAGFFFVCFPSRDFRAMLSDLIDWKLHFRNQTQSKAKPHGLQSFNPL
jgi:hypothetical protein